MGDFVKEILGHALGTVLNPVLEYVDVNGVVQRINVDELAEKVDVNAVLDKIAINRLLDRVDFNRQLQRIDYDSVLERVDMNEIVRRSDMGAILAQSTSGVFTPILDAIRTQIVFVDLFLLRMTRFRIRDHKGVLPPRPGASSTSRQRDRYPKGRMNKAIAVQGRYAGFFSKAVAIFVDVMLITVSFALLTIILKLCWILFLGTSNEVAQQKVSRENLGIVILYCIFWFLCFFLGVLPTGQTLGMVFAGIRLRRSDGLDDFTAGQAAIRTLLLPLSLTVMPVLGLIGYLRSDGRMLHDIVAGTGLVYCWDARMAKARRSAEIRMEQMQYQPSDMSLESDSDSESPLMDECDSDTFRYATFDDSGTVAKHDAENGPCCQ